MKPVRVGIINCDLHAIYYVVPMCVHDPSLLWDVEVGQGAAYYFHTIYNAPYSLQVPKITGFEVCKVWDRNPQLAENLSRLCYGKPVVCDTFENASDDVDLVLVMDCNGDGEDKLELASPGIRKGIPTFIDKPLAYDVRDALALAELAETNRAPVMSLSLFQALPEAVRFRNRIQDMGGCEFGTVKVSAVSMAGHVHAISLAQHIWGPGVQAVEAMGKAELGHILIDWGDTPNRPTEGVVLNCDVGRTWHCNGYAGAYGRWGAMHSEPMGDFQFPPAVSIVLEKIKKMVETHQPQRPYDEMVEIIAIATAARKAQKEGRRVDIRDVLSSASSVFLGQPISSNV